MPCSNKSCLFYSEKHHYNCVLVDFVLENFYRIKSRTRLQVADLICYVYVGGGGGNYRVQIFCHESELTPAKLKLEMRVVECLHKLFLKSVQCSGLTRTSL